jgi:hypothetical protein
MTSSKGHVIVHCFNHHIEDMLQRWKPSQYLGLVLVDIALRNRHTGTRVRSPLVIVHACPNMGCVHVPEYESFL